MIKFINFTLSFISLYLTIVWLMVLFLDKKEKPLPKKDYPTISILVPAYNEESSIAKTLTSLLKLNYPKKKLQIIVINDGSTDDTGKEIAKVVKAHPSGTLTVLTKKNEGSKAAAMNYGAKFATGKLIACVDADSTVDPDSLIHMLPHFADEKTGAVISAIKVNNPKTIYQKIQRVEYILGVLTRKLMGSIGTLAMTPGVLSVYKAKVLKEVGGFAKDNMTEDFEIALRLKNYGYDIHIETKSITYTNAPANFSTLWRQRIRWFRGFIYNHVAYKHLFFDRKQPLFGYFQLPLNMLSVPLLLVTTSILLYVTFLSFKEFLFRSLFIENYFFTHFITFPTLKEFLLGQDVQLTVPLTLAGVLGIYILYRAHKEVKERILVFPVSLWAYFVVFPYLTSVHWISAITQEIFKFKKRW